MFGRGLVSGARAQVLEERARVMRFAPTRSDFACTKVRLVVEVDGADHHERARHDAARDRALAGRGWHMLRIAEHEVFEDLEGVVQRIAHAA